MQARSTINQLMLRRVVEYSMAFSGHIDIQRQPQTMYLFIGVFAGIVLVLIVGLKLNVFSHGEERARIEFGRTDLAYWLS